MSHKDFLVELGCEELPPKALKELGTSFLAGIKNGLTDAGLNFSAAEFFAAPRRLAVSVKQLETQQADRTIQVDGPPVKAAFTTEGNPTPAALGFAKKNGVDISELDRSGEKLRYTKSIKGQAAAQLLPDIVQKSLDALPIPKRMRWGASRIEFVRPTQWLVMLLGDDIIECEILGQKAGRHSKGHRFHHAANVEIQSPSSYLDDLRKAFVIADFAERRKTIVEKVQSLANNENGKALMPESLIDEVTALVEWPVPLVCSFEERFLAVPQEALISTMQDNQKYFCLVDSIGKLKNRFITVANIESSAPEKIIAGNEKVVRPRLKDAEFFFEQDKKVKLETRNERLKNVVFQAQLGTVYEKAERVSKIAGAIAEQISKNEDFIQKNRSLAEQAGLLSKCDLASELVGEFPELQGKAGYYYALNDKLPLEIATALYEQYLPKFSGDVLPQTDTGIALSLADKLDTLICLFGINQPPTGSKDPYALRRAAISILRIIIENDIHINLLEIIKIAINVNSSDLINNFNIGLNSDLTAVDNAHLFSDTPSETSNKEFSKTIKIYQDAILNFSKNKEDLSDTVHEFLNARYRALYEEQGIKPEVILAVQALKPVSPLDFDRRIKAVDAFAKLPEASALSAANKRVANILAKDNSESYSDIDFALLQETAEKALADRVSTLQRELAPLFAAGEYQSALSKLASLRETVDSFFDNVMVNAEDPALRKNRLTLLAQLRALFLAVADISVLAN